MRNQNEVEPEKPVLPAKHLYLLLKIERQFGKNTIFHIAVVVFVDLILLQFDRLEALLSVPFSSKTYRLRMKTVTTKYFTYKCYCFGGR